MDTKAQPRVSPIDRVTPLPQSSLIICTRNRPQLLRDTVTSILNEEVTPTEIIIVDQSKTRDACLDDLSHDRDCEIHHIWIDQKGSSLARNTGMRLAKYDILAFIDDDMRVGQNWYPALMMLLIQLGSRAVVTGRVLPAPADKPRQFVMAVHDWDEPCIYQGRIGKDILASGLMAIYRTGLQEVGGFDERLGPGTYFQAAEDNDLGFRLLEAGYTIGYTPDCTVYHRAWRTLSDYVPMYWNYGWGQGAFYAKHWRLNDGYMLRRAWKDFLRFLKLLPERIWKRQLLVLSGSAAFVLGEWAGAAQWFLRRGGTPDDRNQCRYPNL